MIRYLISFVKPSIVFIEINSTNYPTKKLHPIISEWNNLIINKRLTKFR